MKASHSQPLSFFSLLAVAVFLLVGWKAGILSWALPTRGHHHIEATVIAGHDSPFYNVGSGENTDSWFYCVSATQGQSLRLHYRATINNGDIRLAVYERPLVGIAGESLWQVQLDQVASDAVVLPVPRSGVYTIAINTYRFDGAFDLSWQAD